MKSTARKSLPADFWKFQELASDSQLNQAPRKSVGFVVKKMGRMVTSADLETLAGPRATAEGLRAALGYTSAREQVGMSDSAQLAVLLNRMNKALRKSLPFVDHPNSSFPVRDERYRPADGTTNDHQSEHTARAVSDLRVKHGDAAAEEYLADISGGETNDAEEKYENDEVQPGTKAASAEDADNCEHPGGDLDSYVLPSARARGYNPRTKQVDPDLVGLGEREYTERIFGDRIADAMHGPKEGAKDRGEYRVRQQGKMKIGDYENSADENGEKTGGDGELSDKVKQSGIWPGGASSSAPPPDGSERPPSRVEEQSGGPPGGTVPSQVDPTPDKEVSPESARRDPFAEARHSPDGVKVSDPARFRAFITNARKYLRSQSIGTKVIDKAASMRIAEGLLAGKSGGGFGSRSMGIIHEQAQKEAANAGVRNGKHQGGDPLQGLSPKKLTKYYAMAIRSIFGAHKESMKASRSRATVMSPASGSAPAETPKDAGTVAEETKQMLEPPPSAPKPDEGPSQPADSTFDDILRDIDADGMWSDGENMVDMGPFWDMENGRLRPGYSFSIGSDNIPKVIKLKKSFRKSTPAEGMSIDRVTAEPDYAPGKHRGGYGSSEASGSGWLGLDQPAFKRDQNLSNGSSVIGDAGLQREQENIFNDRPDGKMLPGIPNDPSAPKDEPWLTVNPETGEWEGKLTRFKLGALSLPVRGAYHIASQALRGLTGINSDNVLGNLGDAAKLAFHGARQLAVNPEADAAEHNGTLMQKDASTNIVNPYGDTVHGVHMFGPGHDKSFEELEAAAEASGDPENPHVKAFHAHLRTHDITRDAYKAYMDSDGTDELVNSNYRDARDKLREFHKSRTSGASTKAGVPDPADGTGVTDPSGTGVTDPSGTSVTDPSGTGGPGTSGPGTSGSDLAIYTNKSSPEDIKDLDREFHEKLAGIYGVDPDGKTAEQYLDEHGVAEAGGKGSDVASLIRAVRKRGGTINEWQAADILAHYSRKPASPEEAGDAEEEAGDAEEEAGDGPGIWKYTDKSIPEDIKDLDPVLHERLANAYGKSPDGMNADHYWDEHAAAISGRPSNIRALMKEVEDRGGKIDEVQAAYILEHYSRKPASPEGEAGDAGRVAEGTLETLDDAPVSTRLADAPLGESAFVKMRNSRWSEAVRKMHPPMLSELPQLQMPDPVKNAEELDRAGLIAMKFKGDHSRSTIPEDQRPQLELMNSEGTVVTYKSAPKHLGVGSTSVVFRMEPLGGPEDGHEPFALKTWLQNGLFTGLDASVYPSRPKKEKFNNEYDTLSLLSAAGACVPRPVFDGRSASNTDAKFSAFGTTIAKGKSIAQAVSFLPNGIPEKAGYAILHQILQTMVIAQQQGIDLTDQDATNWFVTGMEEMSNDESYDAMSHIMGNPKRPRADHAQTGSHSAVCGVDWNVINRMKPEEALKRTNGAAVRVINAVFTGSESAGSDYQLRRRSDFTQQLIARLNKREVRRDESTGEENTVQVHPHTVSELLEIITAGLAAWHLSDGPGGIAPATEASGATVAEDQYDVEWNPDLAFLNSLDSITELRRKNAAAAPFLGKSYGTSILSHEELIMRIYNSL